MPTTPRIKALRPASFRGVEFGVDDTDFEGGRRVQVHEYPQRDKPYVEDLGRAARQLSFTAFIVGDDYVDRTNRLIAALETGGPGSLVHPWLGTLQVSVREGYRVRYSRTAIGVASIDLSFVEAGELAFPSADAATPAATRAAAEALSDAAAADFQRAYTVDGLPDFVAAAATRNWSNLLEAVGVPTPGLEAIGLSNRLAGIASAVLSTATDPSVIPGRLLGALGLAPLVGTAQRWQGIVQGYLRLRARPALGMPAASGISTPSRLQSDANLRASNALVRRTLLAQAIGASSLMPVVVVDDATALRAALLAAIDDEALTADDETYAALQAARAAVWADLTARSRAAARLRTYTPPAVLPALVLAYQLYGDAARAGEVVERNRVRHPGFVPARALQVLAS